MAHPNRPLTKKNIEEMEACPHCHDKELKIVGLIGGSTFQIVCEICKMRGPRGKTRTEAIENWDNI